VCSLNKFSENVMMFISCCSGLDSSSSLQVISHLKSLVQGGRTIVCSIHQPSSRLFEMFDDLYVLAEGQCLYSGAVNDMTAVFEGSGFECPKYYNRADFGEYLP
jgi:ABC-type multidrug transport system ATPase subunit